MKNLNYILLSLTLILCSFTNVKADYSPMGIPEDFVGDTLVILYGDNYSSKITMVLGDEEVCEELDEIFRRVDIEEVLEIVEEHIADSSGVTKEYEITVNGVDMITVVVYKSGVKKIVVKAPKSRDVRFSANVSFYLGVDNFLEGGKPVDVSQPYAARNQFGSHWALSSYFVQKLGARKSPWRLQYGLELARSAYTFSNNYYISNDDGTVDFLQDSINLKRSQLTRLSLNIPVMLKFSKRRFGVAVGPYVGLNVASAARKVYNVNGNKIKERFTENYNVNPLNYGLMAELRVSKVKLFMRYEMSSLFNTHPNLPNANSYSFGIGF